MGRGALWPGCASLRAGQEAAAGLLDWLGSRVVLFRAGDWLFVTFGLFAALGAVAALAGAGVLLVGHGLAAACFPPLAVAGSALVVVGSWAAGQLLDYRRLRREGLSAAKRPVFVSWGGLAGLLLTLVIFARWSGLALLLVWDDLARVMPLGHALGRLGCLTYGCCCGRPTAGRLAITYRHPESKAVRNNGLAGVPLHPAALYEAILDLGILAVANLAALAGAPTGVPTALVFLAYGAGRFGIEFLRDNGGRFVLGCLSVNHVASLAVAALGALVLAVSAAAGVAAPPYSPAAAAAGAGKIAVAVAPAAALVFVGFGLHRRRVGEW